MSIARETSQIDERRNIATYIIATPRSSLVLSFRGVMSASSFMLLAGQVLRERARQLAHDLRRYHDHQIPFQGLGLRVLEQKAEERDVAEDRKLRYRLRYLVLLHTADHEHVPVPQLDGRAHPARHEARHDVAVQEDRVGVIGRTDLRRTEELHAIAVEHGGHKSQLHPEFFPLDGDLDALLRGLRDRNRELAARQERGAIAA